MPGNIATSFGGMGILAWLGALSGLLALRRSDFRRVAPVLVPVIFGAVALTVSAVVFERYGLSLMAGVTILAAIGWERWLLQSNARLRFASVVLFAGCVAITTVQLIAAEQRSAEVDVDVLAKRWIMANVPRGRHVALQNEVNAFLPRTTAELVDCIQSVETSRAYRKVACRGRRFRRASKPHTDAIGDPQ